MTNNEMEINSTSGAGIIVHDLWKVYGPKPDEYVTRARGQAPGSHDMDADHTAAVRGVSFDVKPGETFVVMGLSGSGKSTLVRCLTRLIEPTFGEVTLDGRAVTAMSSSELRELRRHECAMVFQHFGLLPHRRVIDNVAYGLEVAGMPRRAREKRASEILSLVGLTGSERRLPSELSGGMRQRVGLARALAVGPRLLLLDEPFSALDPLIRRELQDELIRLASVMKQTAIFITHDMTEALKVGDRIAIMRNGEVVQIGTPEDIVLRPADDYVRRFAEDASRARVVKAHAVAKPALVIPGSTKTGDALAQIRTAGHEFAFIVDSHGSPVGSLSAGDLRSETDLARRADEIAASDVSIVRHSALLEEVMRPLVNSDDRVAAVDSTGHISGVIDRKSVLAALMIGSGASSASTSDGPSAALVG